jgi:hypothetical protein
LHDFKSLRDSGSRMDAVFDLIPALSLCPSYSLVLYLVVHIRKRRSITAKSSTRILS